MIRRLFALGLATTLLLPAASAQAQNFPTTDSIIKRIWTLGMDSSQAGTLAQALMDSIGPRLTGSPGQKSANDWAVAQYTRWGISARNVQYGTWKGWRRGYTHIDLLRPRVRTLEGMMLAWSPGTKGKPVEGPVMVLPDAADSVSFAAALSKVKGAYVLTSFAEPACRADSSYKQSATPDGFDRMVKERTAARDAWTARTKRTGLDNRNLPKALERAGARGVITTTWSNGWGAVRIFDAKTEQVPTLGMSCEDYGLLFRLAERDQGPVIRVAAEAEWQGEIPVFNTIAEIPGTEKPDEYVVLSAHFDSWDGSSGATDNGTGSVTMMEAMRILKEVLPRPKRTIIVGHWSGEEQGLNGSRAWAADNPKVVAGLQALFNQDNGTGRVVNIGAAGLVGAPSFLAGWLSRVPQELTRHINNFALPGTPPGGGSDNAAFACYGAPGFGLGSLPWEYFSYTWHTNRDTFDKVVLEELKGNATLTAMLAYQASEDPNTVPRDRRVMPVNQNTQQPGTWPECVKPARTSAEYTR